MLISTQLNFLEKVIEIQTELPKALVFLASMPSDKGKTPRSKTPRSTSSKAKSKDAKSKAPPPKQQKTKRPETANKIPEKGVVKKKKSYSAEELGIPKLNGIIPAGVIKPKGKKKAKVFVDDQERMMMILAVVNAEAEGKVESKMMRQRQLEEVREARKLETERRESEKKGALVRYSLLPLLGAS